MAASTTGSEQEDVRPYRGMAAIFNRRTAKEHAAHLLPYLKADFHILDIGCGGGSITVDLAKLVPQGRVVGVDISADWIESARELATRAGASNVEFQVGDVKDLSSFAAESFDVVHAHQLFLHVSEPVVAMQEMRRLIKPAGILASRDNTRRIIVPTAPLLVEQQTMWDELAHSQGKDPYFGERNHSCAHAAGFPWDKIEMSHWAWEYSGKEGRAIFASGAKNTFRAAALKSGLGTEKQMDDIGLAWETWEQDPAARLIGLDGALVCWK